MSTTSSPAMGFMCHTGDLGWDRYFIPAHRLRRLATGTWKEDL